MKDKTILAIINQSLMILEKEVGLAPSSLKVVESRSFKPIADFFNDKNEVCYCENLLNALEEHHRKNLRNGVISRNVYNLRIRGTRIVREVHYTGTYSSKGPASKNKAVLSESFERFIAGVIDPGRCENKNRETASIIRRFFLSLASLGINDPQEIKAEHIQAFLSGISKSRARSMDSVISSLRNLDRSFADSGLPGLPHAGLLMAPRKREKKVYPCMPQDDLSKIINFIDCNTAIGKRDYAILLLAASTGMRSGDIANIKLSDIDWRKNEIRIVHGKTRLPISRPLQKGVGMALAGYILNGRPESKSPQIFLRNLAPFQGFKDGVSVACVLRRRMKAANVLHEIGDGKTMHGIRRMLGTQMIIEGFPVATVAQVLGHQHIDTTSPYISLDLEGLRECALAFSSLEEGT
jgi:integrase